MAVESANVVGYQTITLPAQRYAMIGVPFTAAGNSAGVCVQDLVATNGLKAAQTSANADRIWFYDEGEAGGYAQVHLFDTTSTAAAAQAMKNHWITSAKPTDTSWGTGANKVTPKKIPAGRGFWYIRQDTAHGGGATTIKFPQPYSL